MRYAVVDRNGIVSSIIIWDGVSKYDPGKGYVLIKDNDFKQVIGEKLKQ